MTLAKEIVIRYRVFVPSIHKTKEHGLIFETREEAKKWLRLTGLESKIKPKPVKGRIVSDFQPTSFSGIGIYGRHIKVWKPLDELKK